MAKNQVIIIVVILVVLAIGGFLVLKGQQSSSSVQTQSPSDQTSTSDNAASPATGVDSTDASASANPAASGQASVKEFTVNGSSFKFEPATLTVNKGDKVKITFKNSGGTHDFVIDEFNVKTQVIPGGQEATAEFTADKSGTFQYYCSVGNHRAMGMVGTLTVN